MWRARLMGASLGAFLIACMCARSVHGEKAIRNLKVLKEIEKDEVEKQAVKSVDANEAVINARLAQVLSRSFFDSCPSICFDAS